MMKFPSREKIAAMPKVTEEKEMEIRGEYADQIHVRIAKYDDGKTRIAFRGAPAADIRQSLKSAGYTFDGIWWTGTAEISF